MTLTPNLLFYAAHLIWRFYGVQAFALTIECNLEYYTSRMNT
jgi:hypothetical protein